MSRTSLRTVLGLVLTLTVLAVAALSGGGDDTRTSPPGALPAEATAVLRLIAAGGPFPYRQDGTVFGNREGLLPDRPRGYYREYTVVEPGSRSRGPRRIVTGGTPPSECFYTVDHYESFSRLPTCAAP